MQEIIEPKILKGFRDSLPGPEIKRKKMFADLEKAFSSFGFVPIDTPVLEYTEVLLGKGGGETDKQVYSFTDNGGRSVAMRYDLTVPFARFVAANKNSLYFPFKRYHISKVWRGENTQRGRYREFYQCDFDIVGSDSPSADLEILLLMKKSFETMGINNFKIHLSSRGIFNRFLEIHGMLDKSADILRTVDKLAKIGPDAVKEILTETAGSSGALILDFIKMEAGFEKTLQKLIRLCGGESSEAERLSRIYSALKENSCEEYFVLDPSITRGLDYYTGLVFETFIDGKESIGSVCSGGRYNNLASLYTKEELPGVGASIGVDRLLAALDEAESGKRAEAQCECIVFNMDDDLLGLLHKTAEEARKTGISCEVFPESKKLNRQFAHAERKNIPAGIIIGTEEKDSNTITVKDLIERKNYEKLDIKSGMEQVLSIVNKWRINGRT
ncbi:MAG: histidine--tRNA ligase [Spirochaetales bacterium]|nr:histidine--tRNA ligase [Spirochaetales bacterium]